MDLYKLLETRIDDVDRVVLYKNIFGLIKNIKVYMKDDNVYDYKGTEEKFLDLCYEIKDNNFITKLNKKVDNYYDDVKKIEIVERDRKFKPSLLNIYLTDGKVITYNKDSTNYLKPFTNPNSEYDKYVINSYANRYNTTEEAFVNELKKDDALKTYIREKEKKIREKDKYIENLIKAHSDKKGRILKDDKFLSSKEHYKQLDIISVDTDDRVASLILFYDSDRSVIVTDKDSCIRFILDAKDKGLTTCGYYPNSSERRITYINNIIAEKDKKFCLKRTKLADFFNGYNDEKTLKKTMKKNR